MRPFDGRRVLLGVTGGIASYKAAWLARLFQQAGTEVDVVMTRAATEFVGPVTFEALTGRQVHTDLFAAGGGIEHIRLAREADAVVVAPATADFLARAAHGLADDLLAAVLLATDAPVLLVPAMNDRMWAHRQTARNVAALRDAGYRMLDPETGPLAIGEGEGPGRMPEPAVIRSHVARLLEPQGWRGKRMIVTAGATRESLDPVRFLSNRSTGKMGVALAAAGWRRGADVVLIAGALAIEPPTGVAVERVETTQEMACAVERALPAADVLIMAAAPADLRPAEPRAQKIVKSEAPAALALMPTQDILKSTRAARAPGAVIVGFALETTDVLSRARAKLAAKGLDFIVVNDALEPGAGFAVDTNRVTLLASDGTTEALPLMQKTELADIMLDRIEARFDGR
ncbi:MAG TPA: bifunctional phosphopantothenoylcysteine decarboxylase/phosphopantothenate--cysteine ligase CoaBC [Gemmatimonadaceae bacterium]|nr:bifunctional phosphopantothenoylcysteine decarboxylase/phosphopantothenate--cysteine ligase CoaBC [Gemmatimonadaceae bacterium]